MLYPSFDGREYDDEIMSNLYRTMPDLYADESLTFHLFHKAGIGRHFIPDWEEVMNYLDTDARNHFDDASIEWFRKSNFFKEIRHFDMPDMCQNGTNPKFITPRAVVQYGLLDVSVPPRTARGYFRHSCNEHLKNARRNAAQYLLQCLSSYWMPGTYTIDHSRPVTLFELMLLRSTHRALSTTNHYTLEEMLNLMAVAPTGEEVRNRVDAKSKNRGYSMAYYVDRPREWMNVQEIRPHVPEGTALLWHYIAGWNGRGASMDNRFEPVRHLASSYEPHEVIDTLLSGSLRNVNDIWKFERMGVPMHVARELAGVATPRAVKKILDSGVDLEFAKATLT